MQDLFLEDFFCFSDPKKHKNRHPTRIFFNFSTSTPVSKGKGVVAGKWDGKQIFNGHIRSQRPQKHKRMGLCFQLMTFILFCVPVILMNFERTTFPFFHFFPTILAHLYFQVLALALALLPSLIMSSCVLAGAPLSQG